jgi:uncharacterized protein YjdB
MSEATIEALESEAYEGEGEAYGEGGYEGEAYGEGGYEGEAYGEGSYEAYGESARSDARRRRARQQQIAAARRARQRRLPAPPPRRPAVTAPPPSQRQAMTAVRSVDRDLEMELDALRRQLAKARRNGNLAMYSAVLSAFGSQGIDTFGDRLEKHDVVKAALRAAPLGLLWPQHGKKGIEGVLLHPAFIGVAGIAAIVISGKVVSAPHAVDSISVISPVDVPAGAGNSVTLSAVAVDRKGNTVPNISITWTSLDTTAATVDSKGVCTGVTKGKQAVITAVGGAATGRIVVNVT